MTDKKSYRMKEWMDYGAQYAEDHEKDKPDEYWEFKKISELYYPRYDSAVLEIGCNTGEYCYYLNKNFGVFPFGIDINNKAIAIARGKYPDLCFETKDLYDIQKKYDIIYMQHVIEHLENPKEALIKLKTNLTKKGRLIISCPNGWAYPSKIVCYLKRTDSRYDPTHLNEFNSISLYKLLNSSGYSVDKIFTSPLISLRESIMKKSKHFNYLYSLPSFSIGGNIFCLAK